MSFCRIGATLLFFLYCSVRLSASLPGWYEPVRLDSGVAAYAAAVDPADGSLYYVTEKTIRSGGGSRRALYFFPPGKNRKALQIAESSANLRMNPTLAVHNGLVLIAWQQASATGGAVVRWVFSSDRGQNFLPYAESAGLNPQRPLLLPKAALDQMGNIFLFAQQEIMAGRITLLVAGGRGGELSNFVPLVTERSELGRGVFFPSIVAHEGQAYILYQGRQEQSLTDEIFSIRVSANTLKLSGPDRLTKNDYHDYAPFAAMGVRGLEWVWQSNQEKNWQVMYAGSEEPRRAITTARTNAYQPSLMVLSGPVRIISWLDFRQNPAQAYAIFADRDREFATGREHNVSESSIAVENPQLAGHGNNGYLLYLAGGVLYARQADNHTGKILLSSRTHPSDRAVSLTRAEFRWEVKNEVSGIDAVGYLINEKPVSDIPLYNGSANQTTIYVTNLPGGRYYLHFRYRDKAGNESPVVSYPFTIDNQIPSTPRITSPTHQENMASKLRNIEFNLEASDDAGIRGYYYDLGNQSEGRLKKFTDKNSLRFAALPDGLYFFRAQAEDLAGNLSDIAVFQFEISQKEKGTLVVSSNLVNGYPPGAEFVLRVSDITGRQITEAEFIRGTAPGDPKGAPSSLLPLKQDNTYLFSLPWRAGSKEREFITVRFRYENGEWSGDYHFMIGAAVPAAALEASRVGLERKNSATKDRAAILVKPSVRTRYSERGLELEFQVPDIYRKKLAGYSWSVNEELSEKTNLPNSRTGQEVIAALAPGEHILRVRPLFNDPTLQGETLLQTIRGFSEHKNESLKSSFEILPGLLAILFLLLLIPLFLGRKRLRYMLSMFWRSAE